VVLADITKKSTHAEVLLIPELEGELNELPFLYDTANPEIVINSGLLESYLPVKNESPVDLNATPGFANKVNAVPDDPYDENDAT
jgi:hypothetical protein